MGPKVTDLDYSRGDLIETKLRETLILKKKDLTFRTHHVLKIMYKKVYNLRKRVQGHK